MLFSFSLPERWSAWSSPVFCPYRIESIEMTPQSDADMTDLRPRVVSLEHQMSDHQHRLTKMEEWRHTSDIADAKMEERFKGVEKQLNKIDSNISRLMWIFIGGCASGVVAFLMNGGFKVP